MKWILGLTLVLSVAPSFAADVAKGNFHFGVTRFQPLDALAYQEPGLDGKPVTIVAFTDFKIDRQLVKEAIITFGAFVTQVYSRQSGNFVLMRLSPDHCGISGMVNDGQQSIDLGDSFTSKASVGVSRVAGECFTSKPGKMFDDAYDFRLTWDLPLTVIPTPSPLKAGGGEPGLAYSALVKAIQTADWNVARLRLREQEVPETAPPASEMREYFRGVGLNYPKSATITGGLIKGNFANLDIKGVDHEGKKIRGVVAMKKSGNNWRVIDQAMFFDQ